MIIEILMAEILMTSIAFLLLIPVMVFLVQIVSAFLINHPFRSFSGAEPTFAVLIPAHNEALGIAETLGSILPQLKKSDYLLVVADNCTDNTAEIARLHGAEVIERTHESQKGKGYALDFGIKYLSKKMFDVLIIIDADCIAEAKSLKNLAFYTLQQHRPIQSLYLMKNKSEAGLKAKIAEFAWCVKNWVRPIGFSNLGLPCQLMGTGMAFPWQMMMNADLANGNIVEDMKLGVDFALDGHAPLFYPHARVTSYFPTTTEVQQGQSKRWEHGHISMILSEAPKLISNAIRQRNVSMAAMALDLSIPPLALLVGLLSCITLLSEIFVHFLNIGHVANSINQISLFMLFTAVSIAWFGWGKAILSLSNMLYIPVYILLKIPNYFSFIFKRQSSWNKTTRENK